jgi:hypothetical protein
MFELSLGKFELLFILFLVILEFWRFIFWKLKILHDELLYDKARIPTKAIYDI